MTFSPRAGGFILAAVAMTGFLSFRVTGVVVGLSALVAFIGLTFPVGGVERLFSRFQRVHPWIGPFVLTALTGGLFFPLVLGDMPQSADHPVHLTRAWHFLTHNLFEGQLSGWSDYWFGGWPSGEDYPPLGDYWYAFWYLITAGTLGWEGTYAVSFLSMMWATVLCLFWFGKAHWNSAVGTLLGIFFLLDAGAYREGGWNYTVQWGVWPQVLSTGLCYGAYASFRKLIDRFSVVSFVRSCLLVGASMLAHPMALIVYLVGLPIWLIAMWLDRSPDERNPLICVPFACVLGLTLAAFWWMPFAAKGAWMAKYGELWLSLPEMGRRIWSGTLFSGTTPVLIWAGLAGGVMGTWKRHGGTVFAAGFTVLMLLLASRTVFHELDLLSLSASFGQIQFQRFLIPVKPAVYALAGAAMVWGAQRLGTGLENLSGGPGPGRALRWGLASLFMIPFMVSVVSAWPGAYGKGVGEITTAEDQRHREDYEAFLDWSGQLSAEDPFFRVAYVRPYNDHMFGAAPVFNGLPAYKVGFTPCTNFRHKPDQGNADMYRRLSVRYVVSYGPNAGEKLSEVRRFGRIHVYEFEGYEPRRYTLKGPGEVVSAEVAPHQEKMLFTLKGTDETSSLVVHVAPYPNWIAVDEDGQELVIESKKFSEKGAFMEVPAVGGTVSFRYRSPGVNVVTAWCSSACLLFLLGLLVLPLSTKLAWESSLLERIERMPWLKGAPWIPVGAVVGTVVVLVILLAPRSSESLVSHIDSAIVWVEGDDGERNSCPRGLQGAHQCSEKSWNQVERREIRIGGAIRRCVWAHPTQRGDLHIAFEDVDFKNVLRGNHGLADRSFGKKKLHGSSEVKVLINEEEVAALSPSRKKEWQSFEIDTRRFRGTTGTLTWVVSARNTGKQHYCFDVQPVQGTTVERPDALDEESP